MHQSLFFKWKYIYDSIETTCYWIHTYTRHACIVSIHVPSSIYDFLEHVEWGTLQCNILLWIVVDESTVVFKIYVIKVTSTVFVFSEF